MPDEVANASYKIGPVGVVRSSLTSRDAAPRQGDEGVSDAWLEPAVDVAPALAGIAAGDELLVQPRQHEAQRDVLQAHPRSDPNRPLAGVFATRSPDRPNPIGLHRVSVLEIDRHRLRVAPPEAIDGTPIVDIKPVLGDIHER